MNTRLIPLLCGFALWCACLPAQGSSVAIENQWLKVTLDPASGKLQVNEKAKGRTVLKDGVLLHAKGTAKVIPVNDPVFGPGQAIEAGASKVSLFPSLPFALVRSTLTNDAKTPRSIDKISLVTLAVDLGHPASELRTLGTGGFKTGGFMKPGTPSGKPVKKTAKQIKDDVDLNTDESANEMPPEIPGSYVWTVVAEPKSRNGVVMAWLTHDKGSGVIFAKAGTSGPVLEARGEYGRTQMPAGGRMETETLALGYFDDARLGLEQWADAVAKVYRIKLPPQLSGYCTWYEIPPRHRAGYESAIQELAEFAGKEMKPFGFDFIQIDDGWQVGGRDFATHKEGPRAPYKSGMKFTADNIRKNGLIAGLWCVPFVAPDEKEPNLCAKTADGQPFKARWSGFCLDLTRPEAHSFLRKNINRMVQDWGYTYLKLDGFHAGSATNNVYVHDDYKEYDLGQTLLSNSAKSHIEAFRDGIKLVRASAGPKVFVLACAMTQNMHSYGGSFGLVDAMRVGPDTGASWASWVKCSPTYGSRHYFENGRIWYVDPDPAFVRTHLSLDQARSMASWVSLAGQLFACSDWLPKLPAERLDILKRTMSPHGATARPVDMLDKATPAVWLVSTPQRQVVGLFNWTDEQATLGDTLARIGLNPAKEYIGFDFWGNRLVGPFKGSIEQSLPARSCLVLAVCPVADHPQVLSTSRHITQGIVDKLEESWNAAAKALQGSSNIIANDPYELRIVVPSPESKPRGAEVSSADIAAGVKVVSVQQEGTLIRVKLDAPTSRSVAWKVLF